MKAKTYASLVEAIKKTQDNKTLKAGDFVSDIILQILDGKRLVGGDVMFEHVDVEAANCELNYVISELQKANTVLKNLLD